MTDAPVTSDGRSGAFPKAPPDGLIAAILLAFLGTAGLFYVNIMAAIVDGLVSGMGISESAAGNIGSANIYGAAVGALIAVPIVKFLAWRPMAIASLIGLIALDLGSIGIKNADVLLWMRLGHGLIGGFLVGIAFAVIARTKTPDRTFGALLFVQFGLGGLGVMFLPRLVPVYGTQALFLALTAFSVITLAMLPFLHRYPADRIKRTVAEGGIRVGPLSLTLAAIFMFQAANMALLAFIIRLGLNYGLDRFYVTFALGLATWVALLGPLVVMIVGLKFGRLIPLAFGMVLTLSFTGLFHLSAQPWAYMVANCATGITWGLGMAYLLGMTAEFDKAGRMSALGGFFSKLGLASGPLLAGMLLSSGGSFGTLINFALIGLAISAVLMAWPALALDRSATSED
ncbi:MAG: MFS transporter [Pseudomonadota bacterium]